MESPRTAEQKPERAAASPRTEDGTSVAESREGDRRFTLGALQPLLAHTIHSTGSLAWLKCLAAHLCNVCSHAPKPHQSARHANV